MNNELNKLNIRSSENKLVTINIDKSSYILIHDKFRYTNEYKHNIS